MSDRVLLAVDETAASDRALEYLARWTRGHEATVLVVHALREAATTARAGSGAAVRAQERLERDREAAQPITMRAVEALKDEGLDPGAIDDGILYVSESRSAADGLLALARERSVDTLVVGRNALPWHRELFHHHLADELVQKAEGLALWVVE